MHKKNHKTIVDKQQICKEKQKSTIHTGQHLFDRKIWLKKKQVKKYMFVKGLFAEATFYFEVLVEAFFLNMGASML
jgi:hypothetical protein